MPDEIPEVVPTPVATPPSIQPVENPGPWDADIRSYAGDQNSYEAMDRYMREKQQPYISTIEEENAAARALYEDLGTDPDAALHALAEAMYDDNPEKAAAIAAALGIELEETIMDPTTPAEPVITPEMQEAIDFARDSKNEKAYNTAVEWAKSEVGDDFDAQYFHPHMVIAEGDPAKALESYRNWDASVRERYAPKTPEPTPRTPAPATLGADGAALPTPTTPNINSMEDAFDAMFADMRAAKAGPVSPVGSV